MKISKLDLLYALCNPILCLLPMFIFIGIETKIIYTWYLLLGSISFGALMVFSCFMQFFILKHTIEK